MSSDSGVRPQPDEVEVEASRRLSHHRVRSVREELAALVEYVDPDARQDQYGTGEVVGGLERRVADLLGTEACVLMPSGTMAQQIALRIWCDRAHSAHVAFHPTCHLEIHERDAYRRLHGLSATLIGSHERLFTLQDLESLVEPPAAILFELPQREIGGHLPEWDDLVAMTGWARERGIRNHLDGARLWECQPFYDRPYTEIAGLFDSVYVSFYKILGGVAGAALAGPSDLIDEARVWQRRHGGNLVHMYPLALSAGLGLDRHLDLVGEYHAKAREIAVILGDLPGVSVSPDPPHTNMMHVYVTGDRERLMAGRRKVIIDHDVELFRGLSATEVPGVHRFELTVGDSALELKHEEMRSLFETLLADPHD